ncbi:MAG: PQQ-binding-like beta-propeller repeat protein [Phycisphaerales bacterium]
MTEMPTEKPLDSLVFIGFNSRVVALDRYTGELAWDWQSPEGTGFVSMLLDGDRLIVSVSGYTYCLDPIFGQEVWRNPLKGFGTGTPCIASTHASTAFESNQMIAAAANVILQQQAAAAAAAAG